MKIAVLVKQVPDTWADRKLDETTWRVDRVASDQIFDEINERALEVALAFKDSAKPTEVVLVTMGPESAVEMLRKGLAMGADSAIHVIDDSLAGSDISQTAAALASALQGGGFDLILGGNESTDGRGGMVPSMVAEHLRLPHLTQMSELRISADSVSGTRATESGTMQLHSTLPAVASVTETVGEARFPSFKGIMTAKRKPVLTVENGAPVAEGAGRSAVLSGQARAARAAGVKIVDDGAAGELLADYLADHRAI